MSNDTLRRVPSRTSRPLALAGNLLMGASAIGASTQSMELRRELDNLRAYCEFPASSLRDRRRERREAFELLATRWRDDTQFLSSTNEIAMHPAYQTIIGMGSDALPLIVEDLRAHSGHWYWALKAISQEDPVAPRDRGAIKKMKAAWLRWAEQKGISTQ